MLSRNVRLWFVSIVLAACSHNGPSRLADAGTSDGHHDILDGAVVADSSGALDTGSTADANTNLPPITAFFDTVETSFTVSPQASRTTTQLTVSGANLSNDYVSLVAVDGTGVTAKAYSCTDGAYISYVHAGVTWMSSASLACSIGFSHVPASVGDQAEGTFSGTLTRQDGQSGQVVIQQGQFHVTSSN